MYQTYAARLAGMIDLVTAMTVTLGVDAPLSMDATIAATTRDQIDHCSEFCIQAGFPVSAEAFRQLSLNFFADEAHGWPREQQVRFRYVRDCLQTELKGRRLVLIDARQTELYDNPNSFGEVVARKFRDCAFDIMSAGNCLALGQPTACVLHLGRVMEVALRGLGKRLHITTGPRDTIGSVLNNMTPKISAMPEETVRQKAKKERWAEARVNLFHVKQAWRDNSMHGRRSYSEPHAQDIFSAIRVFMAHLATL